MSVLTPFVTLLALVLSPVAVAEPDVDQDAGQAFLEGGYSWCDAVVLASKWKSEPTDAKTRAGRWLRADKPRRVERHLRRARSAVAETEGGCTYQDAGFDDYMAGMLSLAWGVSESEAKARIGQVASTGNAEQLWSELDAYEEAYYAERYHSEATESDEPSTRTYFAHGYTYCDARMLAGQWLTSLEDAKLRAQAKLAVGEADAVDATLQRSRVGFPGRVCEFYNSEFSTEDAATLAELWGMAYEDAKTTIENKLFLGDAEIMRVMLGRPTRDTANIDVVAAAGYIDCDLTVLADYWRTPKADARMQAARMLRDGETAELRIAVKGAHEAATAGQSCTWSDNGFAYSDCLMLAEFWVLSVVDAKAKLETLLVRGEYDRLAQAMEQARPYWGPSE